MKYAFISIFLLLILFTSCNKLDGNVTLKFDKTLNNDDVYLSLGSYEDTRCPDGVSCVSEGNVYVWLRIHEFNTGDGAAFTLGDGDQWTNEQSLFGYRVQFIDLLPHPIEGKTVKDSDVKVKLIVNKI